MPPIWLAAGSTGFGSIAIDALNSGGQEGLHPPASIGGFATNLEYRMASTVELAIKPPVITQHSRSLGTVSRKFCNPSTLRARAPQVSILKPG